MYAHLLLALACAAAPPPEASVPGPMTPYVERAFDPGPGLSPAADLLAWFEGEGREAVVRAPFAVHRTPLGRRDARLGLGADAPPVRLDDTALGVALDDHLRRACPLADPEASTPPCHVWLEGRWGATVGGSPDGHVFAVHRFVGPVDGAPERILVARP